MDSTPSNRFQSLWQRMNSWDIAALLILVAYAALWGLREFFPRTFQSTFFDFLAILALGYVIVRGFLWARSRLLWSLRNRLVTAYIFIAVVPVLLLLTMAGLGAYLLYWQLGSYLMYTEMQTRVQRVATVAGGLATTLAIEASATGRPLPELPVPEQAQGFLETAKADIPGLKVEIGAGQDL